MENSREPAISILNGSAMNAAKPAGRSKERMVFMEGRGVKPPCCQKSAPPEMGRPAVGRSAQPGHHPSDPPLANILNRASVTFSRDVTTRLDDTRLTSWPLYFAHEAGQFLGTVKRILVIDDEAKLRKQFAALLNLEGFTVIEARNGREGVEVARRERPDLVICDITMPEMNGHRVLETLRAEPATKHLPFVFLTGWGERDDVRTGMNLGADDYLVKPVEAGDLISAVHARLRRAEATAPRRASPAEAGPKPLEALGLTPREAEILLWVAQGKTNPEIATILGIGLTTVKKHLEATFAKLGVENRTSAAALALERLSGN